MILLVNEVGKPKIEYDTSDECDSCFYFFSNWLFSVRMQYPSRIDTAFYGDEVFQNLNSLVICNEPRQLCSICLTLIGLLGPKIHLYRVRPGNQSLPIRRVMVPCASPTLIFQISSFLRITISWSSLIFSKNLPNMSKHQTILLESLHNLSEHCHDTDT